LKQKLEKIESAERPSPREENGKKEKGGDQACPMFWGMFSLACSGKRVGGRVQLGGLQEDRKTNNEGKHKVRVEVPQQGRVEEGEGNKGGKKNKKDK